MSIESLSDFEEELKRRLTLKLVYCEDVIHRDALQWHAMAKSARLGIDHSAYGDTPEEAIDSLRDSLARCGLYLEVPEDVGHEG